MIYHWRNAPDRRFGAAPWCAVCSVPRAQSGELWRAAGLADLGMVAGRHVLQKDLQAVIAPG